MTITREQVLQLAALARLELSDVEVNQLVEQLPKIVSYVSQLQSVEAPTVLADDGMAILRTDDVSVSAAMEAILKQAPERDDRLWKVDAVFS